MWVKGRRVLSLLAQARKLELGLLKHQAIKKGGGVEAKCNHFLTRYLLEVTEQIHPSITVYDFGWVTTFGLEMARNGIPACKEK
jgi:hypothetical protein